MENSILNRCELYLVDRTPNKNSRSLIVYFYIEKDDREYLETQLKFILSDLPFCKMAAFNVQDTEEIKNQSVILIEGCLSYYIDCESENKRRTQIITLFERLKTIFSAEDYKKLAKNLLLPVHSSVLIPNEPPISQLRRINEKWEIELESVLMEIFNTEEKLYIEIAKL